MINKIQIKICLGSSCFSRGNKELVDVIQKYIQHHNLDHKVSFFGDHCNDKCSDGPNIRIGGKLITNISTENVEEILNENLKEYL